MPDFLRLSKNDLQQFEARVAAQEKLCDSLRSSGLFSAEKLKMLATEMKKAAGERPQAANPLTPAQRLFEMQKELSHLNRVYANLVGRGQELFSISDCAAKRNSPGIFAARQIRFRRPYLVM